MAMKPDSIFLPLLISLARKDQSNENHPITCAHSDRAGYQRMRR